MANDFLLKEVRRLIKVEIDKGEVWKKLEALLGDNIKEAVLDSEIQVKKQELAVIKQDIATATEQWGQDRGKREMETKVEVAKLDKYLATKQSEHEVGLGDLKDKAQKKETEYKTVIRTQEQRISQAQKAGDKEVSDSKLECLEDKKAVLDELEGLRKHRDSMRKEIRAMQERFGVRV